jgi:hypothetical protein
MADEKPEATKPTAEEYIQSLEGQQQALQSEIATLQRQAMKDQKSLDAFKHKIGTQQKQMAAYQQATRNREALFGEYVVFTSILIVILTWIAIPTICIKALGLSLLVALAVGFLLFLMLIGVSHYFYTEIKKR